MYIAFYTQKTMTKADAPQANVAYAGIVRTEAGSSGNWISVTFHWSRKGYQVFSESDDNDSQSKQSTYIHISGLGKCTPLEWL